MKQKKSPAGKVRLQRGYSLLTNNWGLARPGPPVSFDPSDQSRKPILHKKGPDRSRGQFHGVQTDHARLQTVKVR